MAALPDIGSLIADKYRIEALLGEGGMGAVFRARHELMDRDVAIKLQRPHLADSPDAQRRFLEEARRVARIDHAHVVKVFDIGLHRQARQGRAVLFMVMEHLTGETLEQGLAQGSIALPDALRLILESMEGVAAAHEQSIVHRDIKAANIFVQRDASCPRGTAKLLDFGISKRLRAGDETRGTTCTGTVMGTRAYMSLEQLTGSKDVDLRADVYAFGVLLYRTLTGRLPYDGETESAIAVQMLTQPPRKPSALCGELPAAFDAIVMKAMATEREDRYANLKDLSDALRAVCAAHDYLASAPQPSRRPRRSVLLFGVSALAGISALVWAAASLHAPGAAASIRGPRGRVHAPSFAPASLTAAEVETPVHPTSQAPEP